MQQSIQNNKCPKDHRYDTAKKQKSPEIGACIIVRKGLLLLTVSVLNVDSVLHLLALCD